MGRGEAEERRGGRRSRSEKGKEGGKAAGGGR